MLHLPIGAVARDQSEDVRLIEPTETQVAASDQPQHLREVNRPSGLSVETNRLGPRAPAQPARRGRAVSRHRPLENSAPHQRQRTRLDLGQERYRFAHS